MTIKITLMAVLACLLGACTTAGPFVTNISSDGNYGLNVEKCSVHMNAFMGTVSTGECTAQSLKLQSDTNR